MSYNASWMNPPATIATVSRSSKHVKLERETELRIEVSDTPLKLRVLNGTAEIFGFELPPGTWLTFPSCLKLAVFTRYGATIEMDGATETDYTADETQMVSYLNVHAILNARRRVAQASESTQGPRVIVVGPEDSGKRTLTKTLINWAAKEAWKPTFVDLDVIQGSVSMPGSVTTTPIETPLDLAEGFPLDMPFVYYYGHTKPGTNVELYKATVKELAGVLERQFSWEQCVSSCWYARSCRIQEYFYGLSKELSPYANTCSFSDVKVFRVGGGPQAPRSALPIGSEPVSDPLKVTPVGIDDRDVLHSILAVSYAQEPEQIVSSNVSGFVYVTDVNVQRKTITYLAPSQGTLPKKFLVAGSLSWLEIHYKER
ncbi:unnamed protein product [Eruca vesicaria subsp. sativa]|uniref:Protein CLP1 homolog n=1 Tax=Eruca vesicaria subsp. sativa TaxID=29727 RepID=A0ABC8JE11_ERUVS|nr:unnamed protein product [Eruca vesicaria subsp. sativa]